VLLRQGRWIFHHRSALWLLLGPLVVLALLAPEPSWLARWRGVWHALCLALFLSGLGLRAVTSGFVPRGTSGRSTGRISARELNTTGSYSLLRNPLYAGNFLLTLGVILWVGSPWLALVYALAFALYYERVVCAEEAFLLRRFGAEYEAWARRTPAFLPDLRRWRRPEQRFSWRMLLRRETSCWFGASAALLAVDATRGALSTGGVAPSPAPVALFVISGLVYGAVGWLRRSGDRLAAARH
jgi:protein-S-isoprenylcysteine O-methyltransferase Ste14